MVVGGLGGGGMETCGGDIVAGSGRGVVVFELGGGGS